MSLLASLTMFGLSSGVHHFLESKDPSTPGDPGEEVWLYVVYRIVPAVVVLLGLFLYAIISALKKQRDEARRAFVDADKLLHSLPRRAARRLNEYAAEFKKWARELDDPNPHYSYLAAFPNASREEATAAREDYKRCLLSDCEWEKVDLLASRILAQSAGPNAIENFNDSRKREAAGVMTPLGQLKTPPSLEAHSVASVLRKKAEILVGAAHSLHGHNLHDPDKLQAVCDALDRRDQS